MPVARFQMPDGRIGRFEVPEGTSPEQATKLIGEHLNSQGAPAEPSGSSVMRQLKGGTEAAANLVTGAVATPIAGVAGISQGLTNLVVPGQISAADRVQQVQNALTYQPKSATGQSVAGTIAYPFEKLAEAGDVSGGNVTDVTGSPSLGAQVNTAIQSVPLLLGRTAPRATPILKKPAQVAAATVEPFYEGGQNQILGRVLNRAAGDEASRARGALSNAAELVPGSSPTVGQASGNAGLAALERTTSAMEPAATTSMNRRLVSQNEARVNALKELGGTEGARDFHAADRAAVANQMYEEAYRKGVDITRNPETGAFLPKAEIAGVKGEITKLLKRPAIQDAVTNARRLAANEGVKLTDPAGSVKGLDYVKRALDDQISAVTGNEQRILVDLRDRLLTTIDRLSPDYAAARKMYADMSKPINQMDVASELLRKGARPIDEALTPAAYARTLADPNLASRATGFRGATLESTMEPSQLARLQAIKEDLARSNFAQNAGRGPGSDTIQKLAYSNIVDAAGVPTFLRNLMPAQVAGNLVSRGADALYGRANKQLSSKLAELMLNPKEAAEVMKLAATPAGQRLIAISSRGTNAGALAPAIANTGAQAP